MKIKDELIKELVSLWGSYSGNVEQKNNLVNARNQKRMNRHKEIRPGSISPPRDLESGEKKSLIGFLEYLYEKKT